MPQMPQMPGGLPSMMDPANFKSMIDGTGDGNSTGGLNIGGRGNTGVGGPGSVGSTEFEKTLLDRAREVVAADIPYSWGSGDLNGPTCSGTRDGGAADAAGDYAKTGFDCSGLSRYLIYQASGIEIPRLSQDQYASGMEVSPPTPGSATWSSPTTRSTAAAPDTCRCTSATARWWRPSSPEPR